MLIMLFPVKPIILSRVTGGTRDLERKVSILEGVCGLFSQFKIRLDSRHIQHHRFQICSLSPIDPHVFIIFTRGNAHFQHISFNPILTPGDNSIQPVIQTQRYSFNAHGSRSVNGNGDTLSPVHMQVS